jgi:hypothetical protein
MTTIKDVLCLLAIFIAYGIAGRLDYEDAVRLEKIRRDRPRADCLTALTPTVREPVARTNDPPVDPPPRHAGGGLPEDGQPCTPSVL